jgi:hypothetical protein
VVALPLVRVVMIGCLVQEVADRIKAEAAAAAELATQCPSVEYLDGAGRARRDEVLGLYRTDNRTELVRLLPALPLTTGCRSRLPLSFPTPSDPASATPST